jgi:hypothetical protein
MSKFDEKSKMMIEMMISFFLHYEVLKFDEKLSILHQREYKERKGNEGKKDDKKKRLHEEVGFSDDSTSSFRC